MEKSKEKFSVLAALLCGAVACAEEQSSSGDGAAYAPHGTSSEASGFVGVPVAPASEPSPLGPAASTEASGSAPAGDVPVAKPGVAEGEQVVQSPAEESLPAGAEVDPVVGEGVPPDGGDLVPEAAVPVEMAPPEEDNAPREEMTPSVADSAPPGAEVPSAEQEPAPAGLTGEAYYMAACAGCHGPTGDGTAKGPDVKHPVEAFSVYAIRNGMGQDMMAYSEELLSEELLGEVLAFLGAQPQPVDGEGLYMDYCSACHGDGAGGGRTGVAIILEAEDFAMDIRGGHHLQDGPGHREYMPSWTPEQISDAEIELVIEFVQGL